MITNAHIDRLLEVPLVQEVVQKNQFKTCLCQQGDDFTLLLYRLPYVIELRDTLVENYLARIAINKIPALKQLPEKQRKTAEEAIKYLASKLVDKALKT